MQRQMIANRRRPSAQRQNTTQARGRGRAPAATGRSGASNQMASQVGRQASAARRANSQRQAAAQPRGVASAMGRQMSAQRGTRGTSTQAQGGMVSQRHATADTAGKMRGQMGQQGRIMGYSQGGMVKSTGKLKTGIAPCGHKGKK